MCVSACVCEGFECKASQGMWQFLPAVGIQKNSLELLFINICTSISVPKHPTPPSGTPETCSVIYRNLHRKGFEFTANGCMWLTRKLAGFRVSRLGFALKDEAKQKHPETRNTNAESKLSSKHTAHSKHLKHNPTLTRQLSGTTLHQNRRPQKALLRAQLKSSHHKEKI